MITVLVFLFQFTIQIGFHNAAFPFFAYLRVKRRNVFAQDHEAEQEYTEYTKLPDDGNSPLCIGFLELVADHIYNSQNKPA